MKETKTIKKSVMFGAIMVLLIAVIAFGATTFAKYITTGTSGAKSARVAKWGFTVTADTENLFGTDYTLEGTTVPGSAKVVATNTGLEVKANEVVVAPGTSGFMTFSFGVKEDGTKQTAEVRSKLTVVMQKTDTDNSDPEEIVLTKTEDSSKYTPVKWTLKKGDTVVTDCQDVTLATIQSTLEGYTAEDIAPGDEIANAGSYTLEWKWDFNNGNDENDTRLGQIMNGETVTGYTATTSISFYLSIGIEQIQKAAETPAP